MKTIRKMDSTGDSVLAFEAGTAAEQQARELFERMTAAGAAVFNTSGKQAVRVRDFEALGQENLIVPAVVAG